MSILSALLGPDKEAAAIFVFIGYYPILKPVLDKLKSGALLKFLLSNISILSMYWLLINLFGLAQIAQEYRELGMLMTVFMLITGNLIFFMLDKILARLAIITKLGRK